MVAAMKPGSVIVDLAVERGGNVEGAVPGTVATTANGVRIVGHLNVPGRVASSSSLLYAKNLYAFVETLVDKETKSLKVDVEEELVKATLLTHGGRIVHPNFAAVALDAAPAASAAAPAADATAKKRGRKPAAPAATAAAPAATPKKRGRPPKAKPDEGKANQDKANQDKANQTKGGA